MKLLRADTRLIQYTHKSAVDFHKVKVDEFAKRRSYPYTATSSVTIQVHSLH